MNNDYCTHHWEFINCLLIHGTDHSPDEHRTQAWVHVGPARKRQQMECM